MTDLSARLSPKPMNVLIACEFSGVVREAFRKRGHNAWSSDLLPAADGSPYHFRCDVVPHLSNGMFGVMWDLLIGHPPCTRMTNAGVRWLYQGGRGTVPDPQKWADLDEAVKFMGALWQSKVPRVALENPIMHAHARQRFGFDPAQIIQPWQFGHKEMKATCLWLRGLPKLQPTNIVGPPPKDKEQRKSWARVHRESPGPDRWKRRSITYQGIADAMAEQWGALCIT